MAVVEKTLGGINARIVAALRSKGIAAQGYSGRSQGLMTAKALADLGRVGEPTHVDRAVLLPLLDSSPLPVFYSVAQDAQGHPLNLNADDFALALAVASGSPRLIFLTDAGGILDKAGRPILRVDRNQVEALITDGTISGGMAVKARACVDALSRGVGRVDITKGIESLLADDVRLEGTSFLEASNR